MDELSTILESPKAEQLATGFLRGPDLRTLSLTARTPVYTMRPDSRRRRSEASHG